MKKLRILLSALLICCLLPVGAGAADTLSQMQLTRQCIAHFQQERPSKDDNEWRIDEFVVSAWSLNEEKDIWELHVSSIMSSTWSCAFEMQTGKIITPLINGQIFKRGEDSLLLETRTDEKYSYQVCDMKGGLRDISIPHDGDSVIPYNWFEPSQWAKESVYAMWQAGVMQGEGQNQFHPENGYTCEQAIATMLRMTMIEV